MKRLSFLLCALSLSAGAWAADADQVTVVNPYVRLVPPSAPTTAAFFVLKNAGDKDVKLVKAENGASKVTELHTHVNDNGVMKMRQVPAVEVKAKGETALQPGGLHVMLIDLKQPLKDGDNVPLTLTFGDGSSKKIDAPVRPIQPQPAAAHQHQH